MCEFKVSGGEGFSIKFSRRIATRVVQQIIIDFLSNKLVVPHKRIKKKLFLPPCQRFNFLFVSHNESGK